MEMCIKRQLSSNSFTHHLFDFVITSLHFQTKVLPSRFCIQRGILQSQNVAAFCVCFEVAAELTDCRIILKERSRSTAQGHICHHKWCGQPPIHFKILPNRFPPPAPLKRQSTLGVEKYFSHKASFIHISLTQMLTDENKF